MTRRLRIGIASAGRFHVLDLARELERLGHDVRFYSYVPRARVRSFGLKDQCHVSLLPFVLPLLAWERVAPRVARGLRERLMNYALNWAVIARLKPCDVFICMSGVYLEAAEFARRRFGARVWLERGSRHILSQDEILAGVPGASRPTADTIRRELAGYAAADRIVIPSSHVAESFARDVGAHAKLLQNPYGVDTAVFAMSAPCQADVFTVLSVGGWSARKGSSLLAQAIAVLPNARLVHVGPILDAEFPSYDLRYLHFEPVSQGQLAAFYAQADVFVLASVEEGLSTVQVQALASGLPLICTDRTGGADLAHTAALRDRIRVVPHGDAQALASAIAEMRERLINGPPLAPMDEVDRQTLSWAAYGERYDRALQTDVHPA